jgi:beta-N-acetylhexosaminidase
LSGKDSFPLLRARLRRIISSWIVVPAIVLVVGFGVGGAIRALSSPGGGDGDTPPPAQAAKLPAKAGRSFLARVIPPPAPAAPRPSAQVVALVRSMPVEQKVAQLMMVGFAGRDARARVVAQLPRRTYGGLMLDGRNFGGEVQLRALTGAVRASAKRGRTVQPFVGAVQQGGEWNALAALGPRAAPGDVADLAAATTDARAAARAFRRLGLSAILGPSLEVGPEDGGAMGTRSYSSDPAQVAAYAQAAVSAYGRAKLLAAPGRFPGLGAASVAPEDGPPNVGLSLDDLKSRDLAPYRAAIRAGAPAIVVGPGLYVTDDFVVPASQSSAVARDLLRGQLGFNGVAIADDLTSPAIATTTAVPDAALNALNAGLDMVYVPGPDAAVDEAYAGLVAAAKSGKLTRARIDEALTRVLVAKSQLGLLR